MRTAVCPRCGARRLKWARNALGMRYLVEFDSGAEHYLTCPGVPAGSSSAPTASPAPASNNAHSTESGAHASSSADGDGEPYSSEDERQAQAASDTGAAASETGSAEPKTEPEPEPDAEPEPKTPETPKRTPSGREPKREGTDHRLQPTLNRWAALRLNIMLVGPAGGGKTTASRKAADSIGVAYFERSVGPQTSQWDLIGFVGPDGRYIPGIAYAPFKDGGVLMLDEIDAGNPGIFVVLNSMTANGHYTFPNGEQVAKHPEFVLIAGANTYGRGADRMYVGRQQLDAATLDRFAVLDWDYDERIESVWAGGDEVAKTWTAYVQRVRKHSQKLQLRFIVSPRAAIFGARMLRAGIDRAEVEDAILWKGLSRDERARFAEVVR